MILNCHVTVGTTANDEALHVSDHRRRGLELRQDVAPVNGSRVLDDLRFLSVLPQALEVYPLPVLKRVKLPHHDHHWWKPLPEILRCRRRTRRRMVSGGTAGEKCLPHPVCTLDIDEGHLLEAHFGVHSSLAAEEGLDDDEPGQSEALVVVFGSPPAGYVVGDVTAGAVAGDEAGGEISSVKEFPQERVLLSGKTTRLVGFQEAEDVDSVVVLGGEPMRRRETVVDGDDSNPELSTQATA